MMMDLNVIVGNSIIHTRDIVGDRLATLPNTSFAAVIDRRQKGSIPPLPYITIDSEGYMDQDGWLLDEGVIEAEHPETSIIDSYPYYDRNVEFMLEYYCYGNEAQDILRELKGSFNFEGVRNRISDESGINLVRSGPIIRTPDLESTDFRDSAFMNVRYAAIDRYIDFGGGIVRRITYDATLEAPDRTESKRINTTDEINDNQN